MSKGWYYRSGDWLAICDSCGRKFKASQLKERWDGLMVCKEDFELRHPQDFVKTKNDKISVPWSRPPVDDYVPVGYITLYMYTDYCEDQNGYVKETTL